MDPFEGQYPIVVACCATFLAISNMVRDGTVIVSPTVCHEFESWNLKLRKSAMLKHGQVCGGQVRVRPARDASGGQTCDAINESRKISDDARVPGHQNLEEHSRSNSQHGKRRCVTTELMTHRTNDARAIQP